MIGRAMVLALALIPLPAVAQVTPEDLTRADRELQEARRELEAMLIRYEEAVTQEARLADDLERLQESLAQTELELELLREVLRLRVAEMYIEGGAPGLSLLLDAASLGEFSTRLGYLEEVGSSDRVLVRRLEVARREYDRSAAAVDQATREQQQAVAELEGLTAELTTAVEAAEAHYQQLVAQRREEEERARRAAEARRREEAARRAATSTTAASNPAPASSPSTTPATTPAPPPPAPSSVGLSCPVAGFSTFTDTFGAPRSGGRVHLGVDMMAARGTPVVAIESGTVRLHVSWLGGISIFLGGDSEDEYFYTHLDGWAGGMSSGDWVAGAELIGYVGSTGNAGTPHLHFEHHPGGGGAVNPYPLVASLC
ncbi:MAG: murein hydrolase activator EnvC family protein [Acidimicrobiia bacterium]